MKVPEQYRFKDTSHPMGSDSFDGNNGVFYIPYGSDILQCIASSGMGWEHVSVTCRTKNRNRYSIPTWEQMCFIKDTFWDDAETVIQYHPKKSEYINNHPYVLHLWRPLKEEIPIPNSILVGI